MRTETQPFTPFADRPETIQITPELAAQVDLSGWAAQFKLGTAGYRDLLDPQDMHNLGVPFNSLTVAVMLTARAQLALEDGFAALHVGGEVRPHTQEFIDLAARIYAAHGLTVCLRPPAERTTPIWLSSFGVFYEELDGGENFTASHSQSFKGGWKPMDASGGQLLELADRIALRVRDLVAQMVSVGLEIELVGSHDPLIRRDFDPVAPYVEVLRGVIPADLLAEVPRAAAAGFRAAFCTEGGSMAVTARRVFAALEYEVGDRDGGGPLFFTHEEESSNFHGIGVLDGVNHGVDPGKWQVYKHVGAQEILRRRQAEVFFIWDPDGDRFNMVTVAPAALAERALEAGLEVDPLDAGRCLVFFKPNQIYFMLTALRIAALQGSGDLTAYDWIVATTYPTSCSLGELAETQNRHHGTDLKTFRVPVGFKYFAALVRDLEQQSSANEGRDTSATDVTGHKTIFGPNPRLLIMAEESGGAAMGPTMPVISRRRKRSSLAAKEKDAMQIGILSLALGARLFNRGESFGAYYLDLLADFDIEYRFYERRDVTLFDESLQGAERDAARAAGNTRKQATMAFFASLEDQEPAAVTEILSRRLPGAAHLPPVRNVYHAGDSTRIEMEGLWFQLRASGTDAVLRYYMEGRNKERVSRLNAAFTEMSVSDERS